jgi:uncharacterized protein YbjT (DUF2867 family)
MNTYPVAALAAMENPVFEKWWAPQQKNSLINLEDLAEATTKVLNEREQHFLAEYPLCSTKPISELEIADIISLRIGKKVEVKSPAFEEGVQRLSQVLFGNSVQATNLVQDTVERLILYYNRRGLQGSPNVLRWLLGREPTTMEEYVNSIKLT